MKQLLKTLLYLCKHGTAGSHSSDQQIESTDPQMYRAQQQLSHILAAFRSHGCDNTTGHGGHVQQKLPVICMQSAEIPWSHCDTSKAGFSWPLLEVLSPPSRTCPSTALLRILWQYEFWKSWTFTWWLPGRAGGQTQQSRQWLYSIRHFSAISLRSPWEHIVLWFSLPGKHCQKLPGSGPLFLMLLYLTTPHFNILHSNIPKPARILSLKGIL